MISKLPSSLRISDDFEMLHRCAFVITANSGGRKLPSKINI